MATRTNQTFSILAALCSIPLLSYALETARMELPDEFAERSDRLLATGFGGWNEGNYSISEYEGAFTRGESRLGIFDPLYVGSKAKGSFTFRSAVSGDTIQATCRMSKGAVTLGIVSFDAKKMHYQCDFLKNGALTGQRFVLGQPKPRNMKERLLAENLRKGEAVLGARHFTVASVHKYRGSPLTSPSPLGYYVYAGETLIAAVELTDWNPGVYIPTDTGRDETESILLATLALAVLRDPANSALEE